MKINRFATFITSNPSYALLVLQKSIKKVLSLRDQMPDPFIKDEFLESLYDLFEAIEGMSREMLFDLGSTKNYARNPLSMRDPLDTIRNVIIDSDPSFGYLDPELKEVQPALEALQSITSTALDIVKTAGFKMKDVLAAKTGK